MYKSPIEIIQGQMRMEQENNILRAVYEQDIRVDKHELLRALQYDRGQYEKGYQDGFNQAVNQVKSYLIDLIEEWEELGDRKYDLPNMQVYNHVRKELDDLEAYISTHFPRGECT